MPSYTRATAVIVLVCAVAVAVLVGVARRLSLGWRILLGVWLLLESCFFGVQRLRYRKFNRRNTNVPLSDLNDIQKRFDDFLTLAPVLDLREFLSGWFLGIDSASIAEDNVSEFLSYAYWFQPLQELSAEDQLTVKHFNQQLQGTFNVKFPKGSNPDLKLMQHLWEPLRVVHKPLMLHLFSEMSTFCTHLLLQALRFERYEFMGFTYWAHGLQPPEPEEVPAGSRRLTALQSLFVDLHSLLNSDDQGGPGPLDFLSAQAQGIAEYQKRLQATLQDVMMPPSFEDSFTEQVPATLLPDITATLAAFSEHIPQLPRLPSMTGARDPEATHSEGGLHTATSGGLSLPTVLSMPSLSGLYPFRDMARESFGNFDDFESLANGIPNLTRNVRQTVSELTSQAAAVRAALVAALPVLNLPDWGLGMAAEAGVNTDSSVVLTWQERLGAAITSVVQHMELDKLFANVFQDSSALGDASANAEAHSAHNSGNLPRPASGNLPDSPHAQPSALPTLLEDWFRSASRAARGQGIVARFSGFSMPSPSQLLPPSLRRPLWSAFGLRGGSQRLAGVDPDAAAALRRVVEGSVLQRSAGAHRSNPDLFALAASTPTLIPGPSSNRSRLRRRLQEVRDEDGNRFCRSVHVTSGRVAGLRHPPNPTSATLMQPPRVSSSARTLQLSNRDNSLAVEGNRGRIGDEALHAMMADSDDVAQKTDGSEQSEQNTVFQFAEGSPEASAASLGSRGEAAASLSSQPCLHACVTESSSAFEQDSPVRPPSVAAHPVDAESAVSGDKTDGSLVQTNRNKSTGSSTLSETRHTPQAPDTPVSAKTNKATEHIQAASLPDGQVGTATCPAEPAEGVEQQPVAEDITTGVVDGSSIHSMHAAKPPLAVPSSAERKGGRQKPSVSQCNGARQKQSDEKQPLVFLHGVGFGVLPYLGWVWKLLRAFPDRPFVLLEVRHVSLRLCMHAVGVDDVVRVLAAVLQRHGIKCAHLIGHSFGTFVVAHMRKLFPEAVSSLLLCDPVCMLTCFPKLLYNFIYRGVSVRDLLDDPVEMARWLVARDLCIASTFCRHFFWHTLMLWPWELPDATVLVLSTRDALVPSELVKKQLEYGLKGGRAHKIRVLEKDLHHGYFLFFPKWQDTIIKTYKDAVDESEAEPEGHVRTQRRRSSNSGKRNHKRAQTARPPKP